MLVRNSVEYRILCDPLLLRRTKADFAAPELATDLESDVLPVFGREPGVVVLQESTWQPGGELRRALRSVLIVPYRPGWVAFSMRELSEKRVRRTLWWSSIVAPLSFLLEVKTSGMGWQWLTEAWPLVTEVEGLILRNAHRMTIDHKADLVDSIVEYARDCRPGMAVIGFFDEGCQALAAGHSSDLKTAISVQRA
jgi:hypothetical protein